MRILVVSQYFWPEDFRVNDLVQGMVARGHQVTVLTGMPNYPDGQVFEAFAEAPKSFERYHGATIVRVPMMARGASKVRLALNYLTFALSASLIGPWKLRGQAVDAIFVFQTSPVTAALPALVLRRFKRAPVLMWILDLWPDTLAAIGVVRSPRLLGLVGVLVSFIYKRCTRILIQSRAFAANVKRHGANPNRVRYLPNWIEPVFENGVEAVPPAPELAEFPGGFNILFAGNIGEAQDMPAILDAAEASLDMTDVRWLIVGDGRAATQLRAEITKRHLQHVVHLLGRHPVDRMPSFFAGADALLVSLKADPVWSMTIPGKVQSYLAAGKPVLAMLDGEGARVVAESGGGLAAPSGEGRALSDNVRLLHAMSRRDRASMGRRGQTYAVREFDRNRLFGDLERWIQEAIDERL